MVVLHLEAKQIIYQTTEKISHTE